MPRPLELRVLPGKTRRLSRRSLESLSLVSRATLEDHKALSILEPWLQPRPPAHPVEDPHPAPDWCQSTSKPSLAKRTGYRALHSSEHPLYCWVLTAPTTQGFWHVKVPCTLNGEMGKSERKGLAQVTVRSVPE